MTIPKIIHQTAPTDTNKWNPIWDKCHQSWKDNFKESEFEHIMWNDKDIDNLVKEKYPEYYEDYKSFPLHILQVDFVRNCILAQHGGIYADMDVYCYQNFYEELKSDTILLGALAEDEIIQNALMCSSKDSDFFRLCMDKSIEKFKNTKSLAERIQDNLNVPENITLSNYVKEITGPFLISDVYNEYENKESIQILPQKDYNPHIPEYHSRLKTKHMLTGDWGKERKDEYNNPFLSYKDFKKVGYFQQKGIDIDLYNFKQLP
jgi:mannosyltransferase OCH1-like enzyme